jgi:glycosyltransferase involved in cell wall biosynthesis
MKVCLISFEYPPKVIGGLGVYADQLLTALNSKGIEVLTITRGDKTEYKEKIFRITTPNITYWRRFFFINKAIGLFRSINKFKKFDLVHLNGAYPLSQSFNLPVVCTFHSTNFVQLMSGFRSLKSIRTLEDQSSLVFRNPMGIFADFSSARRSDKIICPSPSIANELQSHYFVGSEKIKVIPNGIDLNINDRVKASDIDLLANYGLEREKFVLFIGRLTYLKGVDSLIEAFRVFHEEFRDTKLVIVGSGSAAPYLKSLTRDSDGVLFAGQVNSPSIKRLLYESCFAVVIPSIHDTLPTVVLEAMANRKPVIATNVGGNPFMVRNGESGFLVAPRDRKSISQLIKKLYLDPDLRKQMGISGRAIVEKRFSCEKMTTETIKVYEALLRQDVPVYRF